MKKYLMMCALGGLFLASCTSEDVLSPQDVAQNSKETPMSFNVRAANQSRADLNTVHNNFGVWAMKVNAEETLSATFGETPSTNVIMQNYLVGYNAGKGDYQNSNQTATWYYEGLGYNEFNGPTLSNNDYQYLKYWDGSYTNTWFVAYSPYIKTTTEDPAVTTPTLSINGSGDPVLTFPNTIAEYQAAGYEDLMFAIQNCTNSTYLADDQTVSLAFQRFGSRLQIALWEDIPGYYVTMDEVYFSNTPDDAESVGACTYALPFTNTSGYAAGSYVTGGKPVVTWDVSEDGYPATVSFNESTNVSTSLYFDLTKLATGAPDAEATANTQIGNTAENKVYSPTILDVTPSTTNSGLQFVFHFTLHSEDTAETIKVVNARVDVSSLYTNWKPNTLNTYVFKITKNVTGNTSGTVQNDTPQAPQYHALYPIVFDNITIADESTGETHTFNVNDVP